ncbi:hypothetical protein CLV31_107173 [Algoriphagus aquaeductus]|jgi:hypothetical protein|uniref:Uncharacterized protein n=1 Tax=Algoriphagus aquaeductus TaxID=475299 RepID=A0A326RR53_9BACT|nr:hypothetical protein CLV31_107173 [Algoriphagus aquaeductus]
MAHARNCTAKIEDVGENLLEAEGKGEGKLPVHHTRNL